MMKWKNSPQKKLQEVATANELIKNDLSNIAENEFKIIVIKLITGLEKSIEDSRESITTKIKGQRNIQEELKNAINEVQNKMEVTTAWMGSGILPGVDPQGAQGWEGQAQLTLPLVVQFGRGPAALGGRPTHWRDGSTEAQSWVFARRKQVL